MEISVVVPLFNEAESLVILHQKLCRVFVERGYPYEIIYVDDASSDGSLDILKNLRRENPAVKIISFRKNSGQSAALWAGFKNAQGKWIVTLDADLQNPPEEVPKLLEFKDKFDFITGIRERRKDGSLKKISSKIAAVFRKLILKDTTRDAGCSLRMFRAAILEYIPHFKNFHRFFTFLARRAQFTIKEVPLEHNVRKFGKSKYGILNRAIEGIFDLIGVCWLKKRLMVYEIKYKC